MTPDELAAAKAAYEAAWQQGDYYAWAKTYGDDLLAAISARDAEIERLRGELKVIAERVALAVKQTKNPAGYTIVDFLNVWLDQERDKSADLTARATAAEAQVRGLREMLEQHHKWHLNQTEPDSDGLIPADEYADSAMCEATIDALAPAPTAAHGEAGAGWKKYIDLLADWAKDPSQLDDDGITAPTFEIISKARQFALARDGRDFEPPFSVHTDGNGGIVFEWRPTDTRAELHKDGEWHLWTYGEKHLALAGRIDVDCSGPSPLDAAARRVAEAAVKLDDAPNGPACKPEADEYFASLAAYRAAKNGGGE